MGKSLTRKILEPRLVEGSWRPGEDIGIRIDQTLTQDATGTMAYLQFEALGIPRVRTELSVSYIDHNTAQMGFENADDHRYLTDVAAKFGIYLSRVGNGICHQVHLERFGVPGRTLLGSDSHTPTGGGLGMIAIGAGGLDVALAMAGKAFHLCCPEVVRITLKGELGPWVSAKDLALKILEIFGTKGNVGKVFEYSGPGVASLSVPERATVTNMGAECGVTTSVFPSDARTREFLRSQGREPSWVELAADRDVEYASEIEIDLSAIEPLVAAPHSPGNIKTVAGLAGLKVDQVCIGSCTNSSYRDLATVAAVLDGKVANPGTSLVVAPGSKQVMHNLIADGYFEKLVAAGARVAESACGFCIGNGFSPPSGGVSLRTSNRNFEGRSGTADALVYLVSPGTAAASAIAGELVDPRSLGPEPIVSEPGKFLIDDRMIIAPLPPEEAEAARVTRGPNIGDPPYCPPFPEAISGFATIKVGNKITTDHIIPAGVRMKYRSNIKAYSSFVFEGLDPEFAARATEVRDKGAHNVIVAGESYGQGSSREHAAICPAYLGVKAVIAVSFERIHAANLVNFGIAPLTFADPGDYGRVAEGDELSMPDVRRAIADRRAVRVDDATQGFSFDVRAGLSPRERGILLAGGAMAAAKD